MLFSSSNRGIHESHERTRGEFTPTTTIQCCRAQWSFTFPIIISSLSAALEIFVAGKLAPLSVYHLAREAEGGYERERTLRSVARSSWSTGRFQPASFVRRLFSLLKAMDEMTPDDVIRLIARYSRATSLRR